MTTSRTPSNPHVEAVESADSRSLIERFESLVVDQIEICRGRLLGDACDEAQHERCLKIFEPFLHARYLLGQRSDEEMWPHQVVEEAKRALRASGLERSCTLKWMAEQGMPTSPEALSALESREAEERAAHRAAAEASLDRCLVEIGITRPKPVMVITGQPAHVMAPWARSLEPYYRRRVRRGAHAGRTWRELRRSAARAAWTRLRAGPLVLLPDATGRLAASLRRKVQQMQEQLEAAKQSAANYSTNLSASRSEQRHVAASQEPAVDPQETADRPLPEVSRGIRALRARLRRFLSELWT